MKKAKNDDRAEPLIQTIHGSFWGRVLVLLGALGLFAVVAGLAVWS